MNWTMNTSSLEVGMLIRRPGLDEALEVLQVRSGQAKIKLPGGKTSTIPATAEVEYAWPESKASEEATKPAKRGKSKSVSELEPVHLSDDGEVSEWQTDWTLLDIGLKISVLGEPGDFTILRLSDSNARIKHNTTGQIQPLTIGHKFKILGDATKTAGKVNKPKAAAKGKSAAKAPEPEIDDSETELPFVDSDTDTDLDSDEDTLRAERDAEEDYRNGSDGDEEDEDDPDEDTKPKTDNDTDQEDDSKPKSEQLLTLSEIADRTGISYPTLNRYVRDHASRLPYEGEGRKRRYHESAIDVFREIRGESKRGGRPKTTGAKKTSSESSDRKPGQPAQATQFEGSASTTTAPKSSSKSVSHAAWVPANGPIDSMLSSAIEHAQAQIAGLEALIENLQAQRESLKMWS